MSSVNKAIIVGRVGSDPDVRFMPSGESIATVSVATSDRWRDKSTGEQKESTQWHKIIFYRKLAEVVESYVRKGTQLYVEGKIQTRKYTDRDGIERFATEIIANELTMLGGRSTSGADAQPSAPTAKASVSEPAPLGNDDIPF